MLALAAAQAENGTTPKAKPDEYPARAEAPGMTLAAEYLLFTIAHAQKSYVVPDHLVIEVAVYPAKGRRVKVTSGLFTLRLNGKKELPVTSPEMVSAALRYPDWERSRNLQVGAGPIIFGGPSSVPRFPGDRRDEQQRRVPQPVDTTDIDGPDAVPITGPDAAIRWALPDGEFGGPVSGFIYFPYRGKAKAVKTAELIFHGAGEPIVLKLF